MPLRLLLLLLCGLLLVSATTGLPAAATERSEWSLTECQGNPLPRGKQHQEEISSAAKLFGFAVHPPPDAVPRKIRLLDETGNVIPTTYAVRPWITEENTERSVRLETEGNVIVYLDRPKMKKIRNFLLEFQAVGFSCNITYTPDYSTSASRRRFVPQDIPDEHHISDGIFVSLLMFFLLVAMVLAWTVDVDHRKE